MNYFELKFGLKTLYDKLEYQELTYQQIVRIINAAIPFKECSITGLETISLDNNNFTVTGCYYAEDDVNNKPPIVIEILFPKNKPCYEFSEDDLSRDQWYTLSYDIITILGHEFVHLHQARKRHFAPGKQYKSSHKNPTLKEHQEYLGLPDEVDAYAFTAAAQMALILPHRAPFIKTSVYDWYKNVFGKKDPILKKLENRTMRHYNLLRKQYHETYRK